MHHNLFNPRTCKLQRLTLATLFLTAGCALTPAFGSTFAAPNLVDSYDSGASNTDNVTNYAQPIFTGTGTPLASIVLLNGNKQIGASVVLPNGQWTILPSVKLGEGVNTLTARQTSGGSILLSESLKVTLDTVAPILSAPDLSTASDTGFGSGDNYTSLRNPNFEGTATAGSTVYLYNSTLSMLGTIGTAKVTSQGTWVGKVTSAFPEGTHDYRVVAKAIDLAGNVSGISPYLAVTIDTDAPAPTALPDLTNASDAGISKTDNITNIDKPTFSVKAEKNAKVTLYRHAADTIELGSAFSNSNGTATITPAVAIPAAYFEIYAKVTDKAGNVCDTISPSFTLAIDKTPPLQPDRPGLDSYSYTGTPFSPVTNQTQPTIDGLLSLHPQYDLGEVNVVFANGASTYSTSSDAKETIFKVQAPKLTSGIYQVTVQVSDVAGNRTDSAPLTLTVDTIHPTLTLAPITGASATSLGIISGTAADSLSGLAGTGIALQRKSDNQWWDGSAWGPNPVNLPATLSGTNWTYTGTLPTGADFPSGTCTLLAWSTDNASNQSAVTTVTLGNDAPVNSGVTPGSGSSEVGMARDFTATYLDINGASDIVDARLLIAPALSPTGTLTGRYVGGKLYLLSDNGQTSLGGFAPGSTNLISNSQGTLDCSKTTVTVNGNAVIIKWNFIPKAVFAGSKKLYALVVDNHKAQDGWDLSGSWDITSAPIGQAISPSGNSS